MGKAAGVAEGGTPYAIYDSPGLLAPTGLFPGPFWAPGTPVVEKARLGERGLWSLASGPLGLCLSLCLV